MSTAKDREALEVGLATAPDDRAAHAAYADWLHEHGDPRGEFIQVQLALEDESRPPAERKQLHDREKALLKAHQREWLGELAPFLRNKRETQFRWARGWLTHLGIKRLSVEFARALAVANGCRLLRDLAIDAHLESNTEPSLHILCRSRFWSNVRRLRLGRDPGDDSGASQPLSHCSVTGLVRLMPRLEELYLFGYGTDAYRYFALPSLTHLRILQVYYLTEYPLIELAENPALGQLTHLLLVPRQLWFDETEAYLSIDQLRDVVRSPHLKSLTHLRFRGSDIGDAGCQELVDSGILRRLKTLDLRHGCITDAGAALLAACPDLARLDHLDVDRNGLTTRGIDALRRVCKSLRADDQQSEGEVDGNRYRNEGDWE